MDVLFKHLGLITAQRERSQLDAAVLRALSEVVGTDQLRLHEVFRLRDEFYFRPSLWMQQGRVIGTESGVGDEQVVETQGVPLSRFPALLAALNQRARSVEQEDEHGQRVQWIPIWVNERIASYFEVKQAAGALDTNLAVLDAILNVYRNYLNLLDDSERDALTGLLNRRTFDDHYTRLVGSTIEERRKNETSPLRHWLAVVDIDHFKRVNDQFGHLYGDEVLILIANLLRLSFRPHDRIFRFGGEEFVILLRTATLEDARSAFERLRASVERYSFPQVGRVTISLGFTAITNASSVRSLGSADQALYHAKENARNRVCYYEELLETGELQSLQSNETAEFF